MTPSQPTAILLVSCPDQRGIVAALYDSAVHGNRLRGASTITQQVMKNFLLTGDRDRRPGPSPGAPPGRAATVALSCR